MRLWSPQSVQWTNETGNEMRDYIAMVWQCDIYKSIYVRYVYTFTKYIRNKCRYRTIY